MRYPQLYSVVFTAALVGVFAIAAPFAQPKGERLTVTGEVVEMWCYLEAGDRGAAKKACAAQELLLNKMSERVTVTGTLVKNPKAQMIYIETVR